MRRWPPLLARWSRRSWSCCLAATSTPTSRTSSRRAGRRATGLYSASAGSNTRFAGDTVSWRGGNGTAEKISAYAVVVEQDRTGGLPVLRDGTAGAVVGLVRRLGRLLYALLRDSGGVCAPPPPPTRGPSSRLN